MQSNILSRTTDPALRVLVVWVPFMGASKHAINSNVFPGSRITSFWDPGALASQWLSGHVTHQPGPTWDYYLLFGPAARWAAVPGPVVSQGGPVVATGGQLLTAIRPLLH